MNVNILTVFLTSCLFAEGFCQVQDYRAAVVEYNPSFLSSESATALENVKRYEELMKNAAAQRAQIIVFPEHGLNVKTYYSPIPDPINNIVPCNNLSFVTTDVVKKLSCASMNNNIYSVINLLEKRECVKGENCPPRGFFVYNTNVVFDRKGMVIARYAKFNLFDELLTDKTKNPEISFFDTDFGVRFGTFICFDILFGTPPLQLIEQYQIRDFVFSTFWFSELPFLTALQAQRGWAETNNVNLLASGVNLPKIGSTGSGIFNGKFGALEEVFLETNATKLLVATIPKVGAADRTLSSHVRYSTTLPQDSESQDEAGSELFLLSDQIYLYNSEVIKAGEIFEADLCSRNYFCCKFRVAVEKLEKDSRGYNFRAMVMDGVRRFGKTATGGVQSCAVVLCNGPSILNCTSRVKDLPELFKFKQISISGHFNLRNAFQMPSTLTDGPHLLPLPSHKYEFKKKEVDGKMEVSLDLLWPVTHLRTFAIFGRDFTRDGDPPSPVIKSSARAVDGSLFLFFLLAFYALFLARN